MSDDPAAIRALAKRFFDYVETGDIKGLIACYAPDARIWHNTDRLEQGPADNEKTLSAMVTRIVDRVYADRRESLLLLLLANLALVAYVWLSRSIPRWRARRLASTWSPAERSRFRRARKS